MADRAVILATYGLTKTFGPLRAVDDLSLSVGEGDIYGFLGLNGAGKTTTLRMILGLLRPASGSIGLFGHTVRSVGPESRRGLGAMVEGPAFYARLTGIENLRCLARFDRRDYSEAAALALLAKVGLEAAARRPAGTYSLGMKQRLGIALALAPQPRLVILDEPTNGLDPRGIRDIRDLILRLNREEGLTFLVSSHLLNEVEQLCNRVAIIRSGSLVVECATADLLRQGARSLRIEASPADAVRRAVALVLGPGHTVEADGDGFVVAAAPGQAPALARALVAAGAEVHALVPRRPTLEDLFLDRAEGGGDAA